MSNLPDGCPEPSEPEFSDLQSLADDFRNDDTLTRAAEAFAILGAAAAVAGIFCVGVYAILHFFLG